MSEKKFNSTNSDYNSIPTINYKEYAASQMIYSNVVEVETIDFLNNTATSNTKNYEKKASTKTENFDYSKYINSNAPFDEQTQYQEMTFETSQFSMWVTAEKNKDKYKYKVIDGISHYEINKTVSELCDEMPLSKLWKDYQMSEDFITMIKERSGNGKTKIIEVFTDPSGMEAVLCQDVEGNYRLDYSMTNATEFGDIVFDATTGLSENFGLANNGNAAQKEASQKVAKYVYNKVLEERKKNSNCTLSFKGYSLGGATCEYGYLEVCDIPGSEDVLGPVTLINPLHGGLTDEEVQKIKSAKKMNLYVNEYDFVHTINNFDDFKDGQVTIKGYDPVFEKNVNQSFINLMQNDYHILENLRNKSFIKVAFNEDGSIKKNEAKVYNRSELLEKYYDLSNVEDNDLWAYVNVAMGLGASKIFDGTGVEIVDDSISTLFSLLAPRIDGLISPVAMHFGQMSFGDIITENFATKITSPVKTVTSAASVFLDIPSAVSNFIPEGFSPITDFYKGFANQFQNMGDQIQDFGCNVAEDVSSAVNWGGEQLWNCASGVWSWCCNLF